MILRSIQIEGWRCFAASLLVGPFGNGLNIIHGPNGIGKSTLMMALARGLFDSHNVGGVDIKAIRPWGRDLAPSVTIEFEQGSDQFQLCKQFLDSASAKLLRKEEGKFEPIADGRAADDQAREILGGESTGRGASDQRHWGLAQILWAAQGRLTIDSLAVQTKAAIQTALGDQLAGPGAEGLESRIADSYRQFFTAKGKLKSGASQPAIVGLGRQLELALEDRAKYQQRLQDFEDASRRIQDLQQQSATARLGENELNSALQKARADVQIHGRLVGQQQQHQLEMSRADERYRHLSERIASIQRFDEELTSVASKLNQLRNDLPVQERLVEGQQIESQRTAESLRNIRGKRNELTKMWQMAQQAERYVRNLHNSQALEKQLTQIDAATSEIDRLRAKRAGILAPDKKTIQKIAKVARQRDDARLKLDAALVTVSIRLESDLQIEITQAEDTGLKRLAASESVAIKGVPDIGFQIPGVGQFRATGPTGDFVELQGKFASAQETFVELTTGFGTDDLAALEALHVQADELEQQIHQAAVKLDTLSGGGSTEQLRAEQSLARNALDEVCRDYSEWKQFPPDDVELSRLADEARTQVDRDIENAELVVEQTRKSLQRESAKLDRQKSEIAILESRLTTLEVHLTSLRDDGLDDPSRRENLTSIALERDAARGKLAAVDQQIQELGADPQQTLSMLESQQAAIRDAADDAERKLQTESGRLEQITSEAPYATLVGVEETIARLEDDIRRQQLELNAIALLHETVSQQKSESMRDLIEPIRQRSNLILQRIAGSRFDGVQFDHSLLPTGVEPRSNDVAVGLNQISGGEQEQVQFAVRMALADVVFPEGRQLVVLDDVFTCTDTSRLARIATLLDEAAQRFQIVLLTCHPERYRGLSKAEFFDLERLIN